MTREEAIKKLQKQKAKYLEEWVDYSGVTEAYDMAIEALQAKTDGGLISRADAIDALCHNCAYYTDAQCKTDSGYWCESGAMIRGDIPSADRPNGERIEE